MSYKKLLLTLLIFLGFYPSFSSANFETQWFTSFKEANWKIVFSCEKACIVLLGDLSSNDKINLSWKLNWKWWFWYWFLFWQQFAQWEWMQLTQTDISTVFDFNKLTFLSQLPSDAKVVLIFEWQIQGSLDNLTLSKKTFWEKIKQIWTDFMTVEWIKPYSINLRYGTMILWTSVVKIFYILFILTILIFLVLWRLNKKTSLYIALSFFLVISFKNLYDYSNIYFGWVKDYYEAKDWSKNFYNMYDYYEFTDKSRKIMGIDKSRDQNSCKYYAKCVSDWPYCYYWRADFMSPCKKTDDIKDANFILLFKQDIPVELKNKKVLYEQNQNYLLKK